MNRFTVDDSSPSSEENYGLAFVKGDERYIFIYTYETRKELLRRLGRLASNPDLSFTWYDAAVISQKVRKMTNQNEQ